MRCIWKSKRGFAFITPKQNATHTPPGADSPRENLAIYSPAMWISFEAMAQAVFHPTLERYASVEQKLYVGDVEPRPVLAVVVPFGWFRCDLPGGGAPAGVCLSWLPVTTDVRVLSELAASIHVDAAPRMDTFRRRALNTTEYTSDATLENGKKATIPSVG